MGLIFISSQTGRIGFLGRNPLFFKGLLISSQPVHVVILALNASQLFRPKRKLRKSTYLAQRCWLVQKLAESWTKELGKTYLVDQQKSPVLTMSRDVTQVELEPSRATGCEEVSVMFDAASS